MASSAKSSKNPTNAVRSNSKVLNEEDKISNLPEDLLLQILELLTTEEAVATSVLSKRWRFLWTSITNLVFFYERKMEPLTNFVNYVNRVLLLHDSPSLQKFSLHLITEFIDDFHVNKWISDAVTRNVRELELGMEVDYFSEMELPSCVFYCKAVEVLKLHEGFMFKIPKAGSVCFPNLKVLHLDYVYCDEIPAEEGFICFPALKTLHLVCIQYEEDEDTVSKLVRNCPVLEDLYIRRNPDSWNIDICAPAMRSAVFDFDYESSGYKVQIDAPALQYLTINVWDLADELLMKESHSLIEAKLISVLPVAFLTMEQSSNAHKLIKAVDKAQHLFVSNDYVGAIKAGIGVFPLFCNLTRLEVEVSCCELSVLQCFVQNSTNLQYLVIKKGRKSCEVEEKWWTELASVPKCFLSTLKRVEIHVVGCTDEVALIKYILKNGKVLEKITIHTCWIELRNTYQLLQKISMFLGGSTECEVAFRSLH